MSQPQPPLVSIALCTYNGERFIREQLDSLLNQTYNNIEIIAVDDASADNTFAILQEYSAKHPHIQVYQNTENLGFTRNFIKAASLVSGEYVALCDQDDIWLPEKIETQVMEIGENLLNYHDSELIDEKGELIGKKMSDVLNMYSGDRPETFLFDNCVSGHAILIRKQLLPELASIKPGYFHDWQIAYIATNLGSISYTNKCLVKYRQHPDSDTNVLGVKRKKNKYNYHYSADKLRREIEWLEVCRAYQKNKNQKYLDDLYSAIQQWRNSYISLSLPVILNKYAKNIFYISGKVRKKSVPTIILKKIWGLKIKSFWYTHIRPRKDYSQHFLK